MITKNRDRLRQAEPGEARLQVDTLIEFTILLMLANESNSEIDLEFDK